MRMQTTWDVLAYCTQHGLVLNLGQGWQPPDTVRRKLSIDARTAEDVECVGLDPFAEVVEVFLLDSDGLARSTPWARFAARDVAERADMEPDPTRVTEALDRLRRRVEDAVPSSAWAREIGEATRTALSETARLRTLRQKLDRLTALAQECQETANALAAVYERLDRERAPGAARMGYATAKAFSKTLERLYRRAALAELLAREVRATVAYVHALSAERAPAAQDDQA